MTVDLRFHRDGWPLGRLTPAPIKAFWSVSSVAATCNRLFFQPKDPA